MLVRVPPVVAPPHAARFRDTPVVVKGVLFFFYMGDNHLPRRRNLKGRQKCSPLPFTLDRRSGRLVIRRRIPKNRVSLSFGSEKRLPENASVVPGQDPP